MPTPKPRLPAPAAFVAAILATGILIAGPGVEPACSAQPKAAGLPPSVRAQMNAASAKFTSAQANIRQELFTKAVQDTETQLGEVYFLRKGGATQMGMRLLPPDAQLGATPSEVVEFKEGKLRVFNPGTNQIDQFGISGKNQAMAESLMTLGFGGSGTDLEKQWTITDQGAEQMSDGNKTVSVEKLDLVSKDAAIRNNYSHFTVWIDPVRDVSLKQTLFEAAGGKSTGDTRTVFYTNIRLNQPVNVGPFAIKCKGKCTIVEH